MTIAPLAKQVTAIDAAAVQSFVRVVFDGLAGFVDVRLLAEKGNPDLPPRCYSEPIDEQLASALGRHAREALAAGRACYVVPATVGRRDRARAGSVAETRVIIVDLDEGDIEAKRSCLVANLGPATLTVASGGATEAGHLKLHLYWRLSEPARGTDLERVRRVREMVARKVGGDTSVARLQQPIRLAGSVHCKHGRLSPVRIVEQLDDVYALDALEQAADTMAPVTAKDTAGEDEEEETFQSGVIRAGGVDGTTRFDAISRFIGEQVRRVRFGQITPAEAWQSVSVFNATKIVPRWSEARLRREFEALEVACSDARSPGDVPSLQTAPQLGCKHFYT